MKRTLLLLIFIPFLLIHSQNPLRGKNVIAQYDYFPNDTLVNFYASYRLPFNSLVFIKDNGVYRAKFDFMVELKDSASGELIKREFSTRNIAVTNFEKTTSEKDFIQGVAALQIDYGNYEALISVNDLNTDNTIRLRPDFIKVERSKFFSPFLTRDPKISCDSDEKYLIENFGNKIPFSKNSFDLIIPIKNLNAEKISVEVVNRGKTIIDKELSIFFDQKNDLELCEEKFLTLGSGPENFSTVRNFILRDFNLELEEGKVEIKVNDGFDEKTFTKTVEWFGKPFSLTNVDYAVKILRYVADEKDLREIKSSEDSLYQSLFDYWNKKDPTPNTAYNELMEEYYNRVDFAIRNYSSLGKLNGADTDMGKIYIMYGSPTEKKRIFNEKRNTTEVWIYQNIGREFVFVDRTGAGDFSLRQ